MEMGYCRLWGRCAALLAGGFPFNDTTYCQADADLVKCLKMARPRLSDQVSSSIASSRRRNFLVAHTVMLGMAIVACPGYFVSICGHVLPSVLRHSVENLVLVTIFGFFFAFPAFLLIEWLYNRRQPVEWSSSQRIFVAVARTLCAAAWLFFCALIVLVVIVSLGGGFDE